MKALLGLTPLTAGRTLVNGIRTEEWNRLDLARSIGVVAQSESVTFPLTTRELVGMGRYPYLGALASEGTSDRQAIAMAMEACDVAQFHDRDVTTLSGGEFQRTRIARALAQEPQALVLDEPTASLDIGHQMTILELLRTSADSGMAVLLITHGLDMAARFADRILLLAEGQVAAEGSPTDVIRADILANVYGWPVAVHTDPSTGALRTTPLGSAQDRLRPD